MESLHTLITTLSTDFFKELEKATSLAELEKIRLDYLGRQGSFVNLMDKLKTLSLEEKRTFGPAINALKTRAQAAFDEHKLDLEKKAELQELQQKTYFDVTAYKPGYQTGSLHLFTRVIQHIEDIFLSMGFERVDGPEIESDFYNFEALNIPADHPARDMQDTFWLTLPHMLMRTHTSNVEIRTLKHQRPPLAIFSPGRVFRQEATDATHDYVFMQCEGLFVDKNVSLSNLLATLKLFMQTLFDKKDIDIRVRPSYFPFVEPGVEIDISCLFCKSGCPLCKKTGWIEICGAGLTHPNVLKACGLNPKEYSGFAFGFGIERLVMLKYGINDIRLLRSNKLEFLRQF